MIFRNNHFPIKIFAIIIFTLIIADWFSLPSELIHPLFDVGAEANIPTWFSSILLFIIGLCAFIFYTKSNAVLVRYKVFTYFWLIFSLLYFYLSLDEVASLHEWTSKIIERKTYRWVYLYAPFLLTLFIYFYLYFRFESPLQTQLRNWVLFGMLISAFGGLGLELSHRYLFIYGFPVYIRHIQMLLEEGLEMLGSAMILQGCWLEISKQISPKNNE